MGIVIKQSIKNMVVTYIGFGVGAINILFLYTHILTPAYFGLVNFILATAAILMPLLAFGIQNTLVKFYSGQPEEEKDSFLILMLLGPLLAILPVSAILLVFEQEIKAFLSKENELVGDYIWYIFWIGVAMSYFEVFYAWSKVYLKSVFGNFMKEVFVRLGTMVLLLLLYFEVLSVPIFLKLMVITYVVRTIIMNVYVFRLKRPRLSFSLPSNVKEILGYSLYIILGGSAALILLEVDKFMINQFEEIANVAYYSVAIFIATVIIVPSRAMHQITYPLTAKLLNDDDLEGLNQLYKKTSLTLFIASGIIFLLIILNINDLYLLLPKEYAKGFSVVFLIGLAKVMESLTGNVNSILYNSKYYKTILILGVLLAVSTIVLNLYFIPKYGIFGAALASFIALFVFNVVKLLFVKQKFGLWPLTTSTLKTFVLIAGITLIFWYISLPFGPIINIGFKTMLIVMVYTLVIYKFRISIEINEIILGVLQKFKRKTP